MEINLGYLGKHTGNDTSSFLNQGKYGFYLSCDDKLYSVPVCFQNKFFNLKAAIKNIDYKSKLASEQKKLETESPEDEEKFNLVKSTKTKSLKKTSNE